MWALGLCCGVVHGSQGGSVLGAREGNEVQGRGKGGERRRALLWKISVQPRR